MNSGMHAMDWFVVGLLCFMIVCNLLWARYKKRHSVSRFSSIFMIIASVLVYAVGAVYVLVSMQL